MENDWRDVCLFVCSLGPLSQGLNVIEWEMRVFAFSSLFLVTLNWGEIRWKQTASLGLSTQSQALSNKKMHQSNLSGGSARQDSSIHPYRRALCRIKKITHLVFMLSNNTFLWKPALSLSTNLSWSAHWLTAWCLVCFFLRTGVALQ